MGYSSKAGFDITTTHNCRGVSRIQRRGVLKVWARARSARENFGVPRPLLVTRNACGCGQTQSRI